ncbi:Pentatricopeptide repeat-containing protein [Striga hermonthica]|uniref:Pentatricopeptide repeat-containing protein n=1 Tax=Striga hermonthica TaxID=68872 RepID=A0A9N7MV30_STRHE|nr:Pentatricopeptide repeat-containing protein [Striga hermonthica]
MEITVPKTHTKPRLPLRMKSTPYKTPPPNPLTQLQLPLHRPEHKPPKPIRTGNPKTRPVATTSDVLRLMDSLRFPVPLDIYALLVGECAESGDPSKAVELHDHVRRSRLRLGVGMLNRIMLMHVSCGSLAHARQVFDQMLVTDFNSWAVVIAACVENGEYSRE